MSVVQLATRAPSKARSKPAGDDNLIMACITFARDVAGCEAAFKADPTGNFDFAEAFFPSTFNEICASAKTLKGLVAKARIVPFVISNACQSMDEREEHFFKSLADDISKLVEVPDIQNLR